VGLDVDSRRKAACSIIGLETIAIARKHFFPGRNPGEKERCQHLYKNAPPSGLDDTASLSYPIDAAIYIALRLCWRGELQ